MTEATWAGPRGPTRILVAIDGSAPSEVAVGLVADLPWPPGTAIRVVEAIDLGQFSEDRSQHRARVVVPGKRPQPVEPGGEQLS